MIKKSSLKNEKLKDYDFLSGMYQDPYSPNELVEKGESILVRLCATIEADNPSSLEELYRMTHSATEEFNELEEEFLAAGSEIETMARETIAMDFEFIANSYGYEADLETLIAPREW